jgi:alpha,alpha-trehalose phosphorylase
MLHHERLKPPLKDYPPDEWGLIEKSFRPEFVAQMETVLALANGYLGIRGVFEEGGPFVENGTFVNGFQETWPIIYGEEAYGFARTGQTMLNVTDSKIIRLYVDDEPFWLPNASLRDYERRLNMKSGWLDRELLWETCSGKLVRIKSRRLVSFSQRHVAAISYEVTVLNAAAPVVISSEMVSPRPLEQDHEDDPRRASVVGKALQHVFSYARDRRIVFVERTERSRMVLSTAIDHQLGCDCPNRYSTENTESSGRVVFTIDAHPAHPIQLIKYMVYHTSRTASPNEMGRRAEWTLDRVLDQGFTRLLTEQEMYMDGFWRRSDVQVSHIKAERARLSTVEMQQAIRINLFHILQASARAEDLGVAAKGLTGQAYEGHYFWDTEIYLLPYLIYT